MSLPVRYADLWKKQERKNSLHDRVHVSRYKGNKDRGLTKWSSNLQFESSRELESVEKLETSEKIESSTELESPNVVPTKRGDYKS